MVLEKIYVVRHGYRSNWAVDPSTGEYSSSVRTPTGIPSDPALASYGVQQAEQLATHLHTLDPQPSKIYSSPFYRCLQTLSPWINQLAASNDKAEVEVWIEPGLGEFYGLARFDHPSPAGLEELNKHFDHLRAEAEPIVVPSTKGESIPRLHDRIAYCLSELIDRADKDPSGPKAILICTHAAAIIALGRVLTGRMPEDIGEEDFKCYTCGVTTFARRQNAQGTQSKTSSKKWSPQKPEEVPEVRWREGNGVAGGWDCTKNSDCSFLKNGEERGWRFSGDESFLENPNAFNDAANAAKSDGSRL